MRRKKATYGSPTRLLALGFLVLFFILGTNDLFPTLQRDRGDSVGVAIAADMPRLSVSPPVVEYKRKVKVLLAGSGFKPNQRVELRISMDDLKTDISYSVKPEPIANEFGAFTSVWTLNREIRRKLLEPTAYTIEVFDQEGRLLTTAPLVFCDPTASDADKSPACALMQEASK